MGSNKKFAATLGLQVAEQTDLIIDGKTYPVASLSPEIQSMLVLSQRWESERNEAQIEADKCSAAIETIQEHIAYRIRAMKATENVQGDVSCDAAA